MAEKTTTPVSRRTFVKGASAVAVSTVASPYIVPSRVLGANAPSNQITMALVGCGGMGNGNLGQFLRFDDTRVLAVCDVDRDHRNRTKDRVNKQYKNEDCAATGDFREVVTRDDLDTILLCTPDHWHAPIAIAAIESGKDLYGEKPITHSHEEGVRLVEAARRHGTIWQTGSWQRSQENFRKGAEIVRNGWIGKLKEIYVGLPNGRTDKGNPGDGKAPDNLDYNFWVGPAPWNDYCKDRLHFHWRWHMDYGGAQLMDWIGHHNDIAHWGMGNDDKIGPIEVEGTGDWLTDSEVWNHCWRYLVTAKYDNGVVSKIGSGHYNPMGTRWVGTDGEVYVDRGGKINVSNEDWKRQTPGPGEVHLPSSPGGHQRQFIECVKSRKTTLTPAAVAHRSITPGHLGLIAMKLGRKIKWDPKTETIRNDATASQMLGRAYRSPWTL